MTQQPAYVPPHKLDLHWVGFYVWDSGEDDEGEMMKLFTAEGPKYHRIVALNFEDALGQYTIIRRPRLKQGDIIKVSVFRKTGWKRAGEVTVFHGRLRADPPHRFYYHRN